MLSWHAQGTFYHKLSKLDNLVYQEISLFSSIENKNMFIIYNNVQTDIHEIKVL